MSIEEIQHSTFAVMAEDKPEIVMIGDRDEDSRSDADKSSGVRTIDNIRVVGLTSEDASFYENFGVKERKTLVRKVSHSEHIHLSLSLSQS